MSAPVPPESDLKEAIRIVEFHLSRLSPSLDSIDCVAEGLLRAAAAALIAAEDLL